MTKEQAIKHGEVIKWFCDNSEKGVWECKEITQLILDVTFGKATHEWYLTYTPNWGTGFIFIQNDKYATFRTAQADGKVIQISSPVDSLSWCDDFRNTFTYPLDYYRIKPDEPKFKAGDWVTHNDVPFLLNDVLVDYYGANLAVLKLWTPTKDELCVFWDNKQSNYTIDKYTEYSMNCYGTKENSMKI